MMAAGTKPGGFNRQKKIVLIGEKHQSLSLTSFRLSLQPIHLQCQEMTGPPHFSPRPGVSIMPISPQTNDSLEWPFSQNWLPSPTKASVPAMVNLAPTGPPPEVATDGWSLPQPSSPRATFVIAGRGASAEEGTGAGGRWPRDTERGHREGTQTGTDTGECKFLRPRKRLRGHSLGTKVPEAGGLCITALSVPSTCSAPAAVPPRRGRRSQGQHNGPVGQGQAWLSSSPPSTSPFHLHHLQERSRRGGGFERRRRRRRGEI